MSYLDAIDNIKKLIENSNDRDLIKALELSEQFGKELEIKVNEIANLSKDKNNIYNKKEKMQNIQKKLKQNEEEIIQYTLQIKEILELFAQDLPITKSNPYKTKICQNLIYTYKDCKGEEYQWVSELDVRLNSIKIIESDLLGAESNNVE